MSTKTWIVLDKNGVPDKTFEQSGTPASMQMTSLDAGTTYVARAGMESDGLQTLALQTVTFATLQAGAITVAYVSHERASSTDTVVYSYTSTYAPSAAVLASTVGGVTTNYQGVIDSNNHRITFTITDWTVGSTYSVACRLDDIYGETATSAATSITVEDPSEGCVFYIENTDSGDISITISKVGNPTVPNLEFKRPHTSSQWVSAQLDVGTVTIGLASGKRCFFRGSNTSGFNRSDSDYFKFNATGAHVIGGNIMSIVDKANYATMTNMPQYSFSHLFNGDTYLTSAANMNFGNVVNSPQNAGSDYALGYTFEGCTSLVYPPDTSKFEYLGSRAMSHTFQNCTSLVRAADLRRVTNLNQYALLLCYNKCTSLTEGSDISNVTNSNSNMLQLMYANCSLLYKAYYPNNTANNFSSNWLNGCAASGTIYVPSESVRNAIVGTSVVPSGWTVVVQS